jgi:hypothetical protein
MPRANRHFLSGHVWHITHQCSSQFQSVKTFNRFAPLKTFPKIVEMSSSLLNEERLRD